MNSSGDYRFQYVEHLADADLSRSAKPTDPKIPLNLIFTPVRGAYPGGRLLGQGWWFPAIESTCLQISERHFEMCLPNGEKVTLEHLGNSNIKGGVWIGNKRYEKITLKSSCGWRLYFDYGRLTDIYAPDNSHYVFGFSSAGVRTITYAGTPVLTVKRHFNEKTLFYDYHVTYTTAGKQQTIILQMGERPIYVTYAYTDENNRPQSQQQLKNTNSLRSIKSPDGTEKNLSFTTSALTLSNGNLFQWDKKNDVLLRDKECMYQFTNICGVPCLKSIFRDGTFIISGKDFFRGITIEKKREDTCIYRTDSIRFKNEDNSPHELVRAKYEIIGNNNFSLIKRYAYNEHGVLMRETSSKEIIEYAEYSIIAKDAQTGKILWAKFYNRDGSIAKFQTKNKVYQFQQEGENTIVTLTTSANEREEKSSVITLPTEQIQNTFFSNR